MKIIPNEKLIYKTDLSKEEILKRLEQEIEPKQWLRMKGIFGNKNHKAYEGEIKDNYFHIKRIISYHNSFLPQIEGTVEENREEKEEGNRKATYIHLTMRLHTFVLVFMIISLSCMFLGSLFIMSISFFETENKSTFGLASLVPLLMILILVVVGFLAFNYERDKSKKFFETLFEGKEVV